MHKRDFLMVAAAAAVASPAVAGEVTGKRYQVAVMAWQVGAVNQLLGVETFNAETDALAFINDCAAAWQVEHDTAYNPFTIRQPGPYWQGGILETEFVMTDDDDSGFQAAVRLV